MSKQDAPFVLTIAGTVGVVGSVLYGPEFALPLAIFSIAALYISDAVEKMLRRRMLL